MEEFTNAQGKEKIKLCRWDSFQLVLFESSRLLKNIDLFFHYFAKQFLLIGPINRNLKKTFNLYI